LTKGQDDGGGKLLGIALVAGLIAGVVAEGVAIKGSIEPASVHDLGQRYLTGILTLGTAGLAIWAAAPLLERREGWVQMEPIRVIMVLVLAIVVGQLVIGKTLQRAHAHAELGEAAQREFEAVRDLQRAEERNLLAREHLIVVARASEHPRPAVKFAHGLAVRLDVARAKIQVGLTAPDAVAKLNDAFDLLNAVSRNSESELEKRVPGIRFVERDLFILAERRLVSTMGLVMSSAANQVLAQRERQEICDSVDSSEPGCS